MSTATATHHNAGYERRWSISAAKLMETCPKAWSFRYIDKRPVGAGGDPDYQRVGRALHAALEAGLRAAVGHHHVGRLIDHPAVAAAAVSTLEERWRAELLAPGDGLVTATNMLVATLADRVVNAAHVLGIEYDFDVETPLGGVHIVAVADLVEQAGDTTIVITDWKSGAPQDQDRILNSPQLNLYGWCARQTWPWASEIYAGEYYVAHQLLVAVRLEPARMDFAASRIDADAETAELAEADGYPPTPGEHCARCTHQEVCPAFGGIPAEQLSF